VVEWQLLGKRDLGCVRPCSFLDDGVLLVSDFDHHSHIVNIGKLIHKSHDEHDNNFDDLKSKLKDVRLHDRIADCHCFNEYHFS
jgi:hypothetical protein